MGLDRMDREILKALTTTFSGRPVGLDTLAAAVNEDPGTIEDVYEPFLMQQGLVMRTRSGRVATAQGYRHLKLQVPRDLPKTEEHGTEQTSLL